CLGIKTIQKRCYAAARRSASLTEPLAGLKLPAAASLPAQDVQVSKLPNGLVIASLENYSPLSNIGVFVKAGSRYETVENQGVSHVLRLAANLVIFGTGTLRAICVTMVYSMECLREHVDTLMEYLVNVTAAQEFRPWEVSDLTPRVKIDKALAQQSPQIGVVEKLHEAAYKNALTNSLYCPDYMVGNITNDHLLSYVEENFITGRMALVGVGVKHSILSQVGEGILSTRSGAGAPAAKALYRGGEMRVHNNDGLVHALIACEGGVAGSAEANAFSVLQRVLGAGPHVKRGANLTSKLSQGIAKATTQPFDASAFNATYSDSGMFGVYTIAQADAAGEVIQAAVAQMRGVAEGNVSEADVSRAKTQVKTEYLMSIESSDILLEEIGAQALTTGTYQPPNAVIQAMDTVTHDDVIKAAKKFVDSNKTMAASGHLKNTPFVDEV
uniref:Ubiquinol-cytochrome c reductase core protein 2a n=1 Tax=Sparus aurata TaxID=8175 RepID=A0A671Y1T6_SPAAU